MLHTHTLLLLTGYELLLKFMAFACITCRAQRYLALAGQPGGRAYFKFTHEVAMLASYPGSWNNG